MGAYVERHHRRPHQFLGYRTPLEVAATWQDVDRLRKAAASA
jgi:transposase InsO family protein